jgi:hypothetical protein
MVELMATLLTTHHPFLYRTSRLPPEQTPPAHIAHGYPDISR